MKTIEENFLEDYINEIEQAHADEYDNYLHND